MKLHERFYLFFIAVLPIQLSKHSWPSWSFILGRRVDFLSPTLYFTDIVFGITFLIWLIEERVWLLKTVRSLSWKHVLPCLALLLLTATNGALSGMHPETWIFWIKIWELSLCGIYVVIARPRLSWIVVALCVSALYSSVIAIYQFFIQHSIGGVLWWLGERSFSVETPGIARSVWCAHETNCRLLLRPYATFPHPNVLGGFLSCVVTILIGYLAFIKRSSHPFIRRLCMISIPISTIALAMTFSRSAWISLSISMGLLSLLYVCCRKSKRASFTLLMLGVAIFFIVTTVKLFPNINDESVTIRRELATHALELWWKSPLTGIGANRFLPSLPSISTSRQPGFLQPAHSVFLLLLAEVGIVGLAVFVVLLFWILRILLGMSKGLPLPYIRVRQVFGIALLQLLLIGLVDHYPLTLQQGQLLLVLLLGIGLTKSEHV